MSKMFPEITEKQSSYIKSDAERKLYFALKESLPDSYVVFFEVGWILKRQDEGAADGETDFIVCHPQHGFLCIEVKGGGISYNAESNVWYSIDRHMNHNEIKDPVKQSMRAKYSILQKIKEMFPNFSTGGSRIAAGHSVFFPDISNAGKLVKADLPITLIGCSQDMKDLRKWVDDALNYWDVQSRDSALGYGGIDIFKKIFASSFEATPLFSNRLKEEENNRIILTNEQMHVLDFIKSHRRAAIKGGAGTGKTLIALEKALRLNAEGHKTLLTCYNRPLADFLAQRCEGTEIIVLSFHQLCQRCIDIGTQNSGRDFRAEAMQTYPGADEYDVIMPCAMAYSLDYFEERFDAIVCDEGQDFKDEYWFPLELLLSDYDMSPLYIFYDDNQNIYSVASTFPVPTLPFTLNINCRNTSQIFDIVYAFYKGEGIPRPELEGEDVSFMPGANLQEQARAIKKTITNLLINEQVPAEEIVILIGNPYNKKEYYSLLEGLDLPSSFQCTIECRYDRYSVMTTTVSKFKGLEANIVILWGISLGQQNNANEIAYVGTSRAKSKLYVCDSLKTCEKLKNLGSHI